ncbi:MAG: sulfite exporter TauE/SafE family protein [Oscillospiraceae bacterium]|jgi:uncharacterized membrane protein YfcA|nr:sulfite exporter TauE/SafE family protein [Oscillospiraceae bacterium]
MSIIIGLITGITASMGLGGGFVLILWLTVFGGVAQGEAAVINIMFFIPIAALAVVFHAKNKLISWKVLPVMAISGAAGAVAGALLLAVIDPSWLRKAFAVLLLFVGFKELFHKKKPPE